MEKGQKRKYRLSEMESGKRKRGRRVRDPNTSAQKQKKKNQSRQTLDSSSPGEHLKSKNRRIDGTHSTYLDKMRARLSGGHFRMLNEKLYTCTGNEAFKFFKEDPSLFSVYHTGYQEQMSHWPEQPLDIIIRWVKSRSTSLTVADFGCGDARLARSVKNKVFSIDLVSIDPSVIACDMSNTPLDSFSVDIAVFCLSLMGTDFPSYLQEAHRILKPGGWLLIAEVKSRFDPNTGGADPNRFLKGVCELGFTSVSKDFSNKMFLLFFFQKKEKQSSPKKEIGWPELKPCLYKRR